MKNRNQAKKFQLFALFAKIVLLLQHIKNKNLRFPVWQVYPSNLLFTYLSINILFYIALTAMFHITKNHSLCTMPNRLAKNSLPT